MRLKVLMAVGVAVVVGVAPLVGAQGNGWTAPRTSDGQPDLQGVWANNNITPLERPEAWAGKAELTDEEVAALRIAAANAVGDGDALFGDQLVLAAIEGIEATSYDPTTGNYNQFWIANRDFSNQTSLIIDPPDGQVPDLVPEARERFREAAEYGRAHPADSYTDRPLSERCVTYGVPRLGAGYNSYYQVFQSKDYVVILHEMNHDARVIPLVGLPHVDDDVRQLHGDSRGHWEGDTLVVETKNFSKTANFRGSSDGLHMIERLTRESPEVLRYEVTLTDSSVWTKPWTVSIPLVYSEEPMFEYACHEGNIGMEGILAGHRAEEREAGQ
ncbi:MAG: hypothetical protein CL483_06325 [Acidobacteria bacterium]|nr:hypothetical protein [Acidobacteriota bacterium]|tara:strand:+ start:822 stop:1808 length:987 start_codon:yes stop_codon:yes gene_type:complete